MKTSNTSSKVKAMTPHRMIAQMQVDPASVAFTAVTAAALSTVVSGVNLFLGLALLVMMLLDQMSGMLKAIVLFAPDPKNPQDTWFDGRKFMRGGAQKGLVVVGVLAAGVVDAIALHVPAWGDLTAQVTPATKGALAYAILGQLGSVLRNVSIVKEARYLTAFMMRRSDAMKLGHEPPVRREAYDHTAVRYEKELETTTGETFHEAAKKRDQEADDV